MRSPFRAVTRAEGVLVSRVARARERIGASRDFGPRARYRRSGAAGRPSGGPAGRAGGAQWAPWSVARLRDRSISSSASTRPTQLAPSTDLPGSRSL